MKTVAKEIVMPDREVTPNLISSYARVYTKFLTVASLNMLTTYWTAEMRQILEAKNDNSVHRGIL